MNGNGDPNDEYGYIPYFQSLFSGPLHVYYLGTKGDCNDVDRFLDEDGTVKPWYMHKNAWALVSKGAEWYQEIQGIHHRYNDVPVAAEVLACDVRSHE